MKKHPVDDLFKRKLAELERKPSSDAWLKIQEGNKTQRRHAGWPWYAAASILVVMLGGYLVWRSEANGLIHPDNNQNVVAKMNKKEPTPPTKEIEKEHVAELPEVIVESANENSISKATPAGRNEKNHKVEKANPENIPTTQNEIAVAALQEKQAATHIEPNYERPSIAPKIEEVKILPDEPAVSQVSKQDTEPTRTIIVAVETSGSELDDKPKNSRFSRVFRQLKNARAGERVDWEEVGFNPKTLVAKVDDRLHNREDKVSGKDQTPKERTKL
ncbi:hypothetical protein [Dyadobacter pollutisoli]|jgi:hypothetical protein|uniref:Uncharacterized protein n=1 Tax=Dyadobacter pollutisoli TaxID=2910158 RepID=A0A9E8SKD5_9BACT|nr:hypothetical protein [Dyadobacter pollutisoli]WAC10636.1 hypothetical protein ON006_23195 [Dyadobacter pollutisoli]